MLREALVVMVSSRKHDATVVNDRSITIQMQAVPTVGKAVAFKVQATLEMRILQMQLGMPQWHQAAINTRSSKAIETEKRRGAA